MEQRRPRLGDIVDDYCPRERRITNHAVVAMIEDAVKQTRCTTCDADHEYKQARIPAQRRKKAGASALDGHPLAESARGRMITHEDAEDQHGVPPLDEEGVEAAAGTGVADVANSGANGVDHSLDHPVETPDEHAVDEPAEEPAALAAASDDEPREPQDEGPVHRRLIRAQLPRPEGQVPERKAPDFTIRQQGQRGRFDQNSNGNTNRAGREQRRTTRGPHSPSGGGPQRFGGPRHQGGAGGGGQRPNGPRPAGGGGGQQRQGRAGGRKRGR